jgi:nitroreductase
LARHSVRRYDSRPLDSDTLALVRNLVEEVKPLVPANRFEVLTRNLASDEDYVRAAGAYGRIFGAPHCLVPYIVGESYPLVDLGYRVEQIAVGLARLDIGSCYLGALKREDVIRSRFGLPGAARIGALLVFGHPATDLGSRALNAVTSFAVGATSKHPPERLFFRDTFDRPAVPPDEWMPIVEAARSAPSAVNAQPWRLLWRDDTLYLFVRRENPRYGRGSATEYRFYDGGICMGNIALAMEALGRPVQWRLLFESDPDVPPHPPHLQPLATLL